MILIYFINQIEYIHVRVLYCKSAHVIHILINTNQKLLAYYFNISIA
jgi:hypothetical protein